MNVEDHSTPSNVHTMEQPAKRDSEIVSAAQAGSPEAFSELYALYSGRLYRRPISITGNPADAEDALQETFLRGYLALHLFEGRASFYSWMTQIAINTALMIIRKRRTRPEILFDPQLDFATDACAFQIKDSTPNPEQVYDMQQRRANLVHAIRNLKEHLRIPLQMQVTRESPIKEIGRTLNLSEAAVKTRLHRARRQISMHIRGRDARADIPPVSTASRDTQPT
jgi:RNA polymerase sigma-70 factor (ECF subfamily)